MRDTLSTARADIYDYIITPLQTYRTRFLPVTMDAFLAIEVGEPLRNETSNDQRQNLLSNHCAMPTRGYTKYAEVIK